MMLSWTGARGRAYRCPPELGHEPDLDHLAALVTPRTKLLVINSPSNPTGAVYSRATVEALAAFAARHDLWLLSDECYDELVFDGEHVSPAFYDDDGRVITAFTFSKTYAMTGWRIGYATGSRELITNAAKVLESNTSCPPSVSQKAAEAALTGPREPIDAMRDSYRARRDAVVAQLSEAGLLTAVPHGAFYVMAGLGDSALDAREFALRLLREQAVAVAPGTAFGDTATRAVRISLASSFEDLTLGIERLVDLTRATA
jgi:aspartate aminotransferase/aminotransferase